MSKLDDYVFDRINEGIGELPEPPKGTRYEVLAVGFGYNHLNHNYDLNISIGLKGVPLTEDEKIRQAIINIISQTHFIDWDVSHKQIIAWLERQKERSMSAEEVLARAGLKPYKDGNQWCILAGDNIQEGICGFGDTIDEALYQFLMEVLEKQKEQKPAEWSEEDEIYLSQAIETLEHENYLVLAEKLKSLQKRFGKEVEK